MLKKLITALESSKSKSSDSKKKKSGVSSFTPLNQDNQIVNLGDNSDWKLTLHNNNFLYGLSVDVVNNQGSNLFATAYFAIQVTGPLQFSGLSIPDQGVTSVIVTNISTVSNVPIVGSTFIALQYDGVRSGYQQLELKIDSNGDLIVLAAFTGGITYYDGTSFITLSSLSGGINYNFILAKMTPVTTTGTQVLWAVTKWIKRISAIGAQFSLGGADVYLTGTYSGTLSIIPESSSTLPVSTLNNDMFLLRIDTNGEIVWVRTTVKNPTGTGSTGFIRGNSVTVSNDGNTLIVIGSFNESLVLSNESTGQTFQLINQFIPFNMWVAKYDTFGNVIWLMAPVSNFNPGTFASLTQSFLDGEQVITGAGTDYYITGTFMGSFTFGNQTIVSPDIEASPEIMLAKLVDTGPIGSVGTWSWAKNITSDVPNSVPQSPHIAYINNEIFINFYGYGNTVFTDTIILPSTGTLNNYINLISSSGVWGNSPTYVPGTIENRSINIASGPSIDLTDPIYIIGTQTVSNTVSGIYLLRM